MSKLKSVLRSLPLTSDPIRPDYFLILRSVLAAGLLASVVTVFVSSRRFAYEFIVRENGVFESTEAAFWLVGGILCMIAFLSGRRRAPDFLAASVVLAACGLRELEVQQLFSHSPTSIEFYLSPGIRLSEKLAGAAAVAAVALALFVLTRRHGRDLRKWIATSTGLVDCVILVVLGATSVLMDKMPHLLKAARIVNISRFEFIAIEEIAELGFALLVFGHVCRLVWVALSVHRVAPSRPAPVARHAQQKRAA